MEMVAAARLRRAEQRIAAMRPYAQAIRKMTRQVSEAAGAMPRIDLLEERDRVESAGILLVTGDRGLAGSFNSQIIREGLRLKRELGSDGAKVLFSVVGRRGNSTMTFRGEDVRHSYVGFTDRPSFTDAREISRRADLGLHRQGGGPGRPGLQPLRLAADPVRAPPDAAAAAARGGVRRGPAQEEEKPSDEELAEAHARALWLYEPEAEELLPMLFEEYVDLSVYRALLESAASEHGARMTAMRTRPRTRRR